jgi:hypothetical protein
MDKDQIVNNLRNAIENNSLKQFEEQCKDQIVQIDTYIKVTIPSCLIIFLRNFARTTTWTSCSPCQG